MSYVVGLDLGQASDFTALAILQVQEPPGAPAYAVVHLQRWTLGTPYPVMIGDVVAMLASERLCQGRRAPPLVLDATGVGRPVVDLFVAAQLPTIIGVHIHGGDTVTQTGRTYRVPKRDLVSRIQVLLQERQLRIARALPEAPQLEHELRNFRVKIDPATAHDSYAAWREADHDDLVLAVALACWWADYQTRRRGGAWGQRGGGGGSAPPGRFWGPPNKVWADGSPRLSTLGDV